MRALLLTVVAVLAATHAMADCAPFYDSLESSATIAANNGAASGLNWFEPAVNGNGVALGPGGLLTYFPRQFRTTRGAVALWYRKNTGNASGGIAQIGTLGNANSIGLFYIDTDTLGFEVRTSAGGLAQVAVGDVLSTSNWVHIVATWESTGGNTNAALFIDGRYRGTGAATGSLTTSNAALQLGATGYYGSGGGRFDELRWFNWPLDDSEAYAERVYSSMRFVNQPSSKPASTGPVRVVNGELQVNGAPFKVKGVGYAPTPIGAWPDYPTYANSAILARDVPLLRAMNVNTIRTWGSPPNAMLLDAMYYNGGAPIYTIVGFWVPIGENVDYSDPATIASLEAQFRSLVRQFRAHPGLLAWGIGNEVNLYLAGTALAAWYQLADRLALAAYEEEGAGYHPTIVVNGGLWGLGCTDYASDDAAVQWVDLWGHNTYFGRDADCYFDYYGRLTAKPPIFTEFGIDAWNNAGGGEHQAVQAEWVVRQWRQIETFTLGGTVMAWSDEWWKAGSPSTHDFGGYATGQHPDGYSNEEWWGMVAVADNGSGPDIVTPRQVYYALGAEFASLAGDADGDGDRDMADVSAMQRCAGPASGACATTFEYIVDDAINGGDLAVFATQMAGPR